VLPRTATGIIYATPVMAVGGAEDPGEIIPIMTQQQIVVVQVAIQGIHSNGEL